MPKLKAAVLMGGPSSEREISLITGKAVFENLDKKKYSPTLVEMSKDNNFFIIQKKKRIKFNFLNLAKLKFDIVFIAMHGSPGEDGGVQGLLETLGVKYTGPGVLSSAIAMNKVFAAQIYLANNLPHPDFVHFKRDGWKKNPNKIINDIVSKVGFPMVVKPVDQGSAVGVSKVRSQDELRKTIEQTIKKFPWLMAQRFIRGKEATCGVLEKNGEAIPLPPTHILPNLGEFYDYKSKYAAGGSTHICPADFGDIINNQIQNLAISAHKVLNCRGMSRTDIFVGDDKKLYILETNTIPGMTPTSLLPEAAGKAGISFAKMLDYIVEASL
jgi:D-alanine-D-alanine ligase